MSDAPESEHDEHRLTLRNTRLDDYKDIEEIMEAVYQGLDGAWTREQFESQIQRFPEGQICIEDNGKVVAAAISLIVDYRRWGDRHRYWEITGKGYLTTHDPDGDTLYGVDVFVHPEYRGLRLGRRLYDARKEVCEKLNLRAIVAGGRIPGYYKHRDEMSPQQYVELVKSKEIIDPVLTFQLSNDFHVRRIINDYLPDDKESQAYATLLEWINIYYDEKEKLIGGTKQVVRVGAVQWQMRPLHSLDDLLQQVEYFVDAVSGYQSDIILFPEFFNGPLMAQFNQENTAEAVRHLAEYTEPLRQEMVKLALSYNINIIAGSMPEYEDQELRNVSYLCRRDGSWDKQYKLHITPDERAYWGLRGGNDVRIFDTDFGKIGILICYDVEFPELPRILAEQGLQVLFVPFWTDTKNAYLRVRRCAQARAIENECYVVISGSVGNLPRVENMDMQYSQAAVFTPSDFAFPHDAVAAEATPNTEMTLIADLDLDNLKELRTHGSVRNLVDRRLDLYSVRWKR
ncbi:hydrolase [Ectothiorhodospira haloalkaliphila]|uniref:Hydrolase n=1 Tax=Ectothiorhodospira haloalkaliphila TaxID=421628 RepID=W8L571_9GAMM|nr:MULTISPECIES: bifunctional GNAT family N-acetyltransferase/carbon-nitrogen hydrolase family protein [Ectothiorhodospira]AHK79040.1 hydrolase [Ectothiorhodospira haloalkaliphila]MCG5494817.1 GNAT family N-acetyltransferase [Ectothiorhodospira variabilis]MCG5497605.1 GNAT family N-acetyltransferase [Ectothiorhodospira variabilis]MCG5504294.1 GNAT family N-acetyltransferase [Ectothiorhodospira variabilis]MCG5507449.1 GNAT family N-acetyltransferase [Ectothiorhodospira variabilis]